MRTTRPHANSPFLSKLPALLAALPLLVLAACGGGEVYLQDGVNPGAGQNHNGSGTQDNTGGGGTRNNSGDGPRLSDPPDPRNQRCTGKNCAQANDRVDPGDSRCKPGFTGPNCSVPRLNTDYLNNDPKEKLRDACLPAEREKAKVKGRLWRLPDDSSLNYTPYSHKLNKGKAYNPADPNLGGLGGKKVKLRLLEKDEDVITCTDGWYAFTEEEFETIKNVTQALVLLPGPGGTEEAEQAPVCKTNNCPSLQLPKSDSSKPLKLLVFGGDISSTPDNLKNDKKLYVDKLNELASGFFQFDIDNIAVPGSTTTDWWEKLKDKNSISYKEFTGKLKDKDVVVFTLGIADYFANVPDNELKFTFSIDLVPKLRGYQKTAIKNIKAVLDVIRKNNPNVPIVMLNNLDYSKFNKRFNVWPDSKTKLIKETFQELTIELTEQLAGYKGLNVVDIYGETLNYDPSELGKFAEDVKTVSLSEKGHQFYGERLFRMLGGWKNGSLGDTKFVGYAPTTP